MPTGIVIGAPVSTHRHAALQAVGRGHRDRAHLALAQVLRHLERELLRVGEDVLVLHALHQQRVVDGGQLAGLELDVDDRPDDLNDLSGLLLIVRGCLACSSAPLLA